MGRSRFGKIGGLFFIFSLILTSFSGQANCPLAEQYQRQGKDSLLSVAWHVCATQFNDDESQMKMANAYLKGENGLKKDELLALYMYQLAAENGNAEAQVRLSELLQSFDASPDRRKQLKDYQKKLVKLTNNSDDFGGEIQHPYTLLLLASERPENKWYYPSLNRSAPARTMSLLNNYKITSEKRQVALKDASRWKTRKILSMAKEILKDSEYPFFEKRLKNAKTRVQAMEELKERLKIYTENKKQGIIPNE